MIFLSTITIPWLIRLSLVILFPFSTLDKIFDYKNALAQARSTFLPDGTLLLIIGGLIEVFGSLAILCAWHDRLAAFILAGYCVITALLFHQFWASGDFWSSSADSKGRQHFWDFLKNFGLAGGLMLLVLLGNLLPPQAFIAHPLASTTIAAASGDLP